MTITPDWMNYALIDSITDSFAPIILQVEMEAVSIDELSLVLKESEQADMLKRISRCRKKSTQLSRLLASKMDVIKSLMKRYEDRTRELDLLEHQQSLSFPAQLNQALKAAVADTSAGATTQPDTLSHTPAIITPLVEMKKSITDTLLYLGDIQGK
jgi:magnesium transporter